jgi:hypothetical protein
MQVAAAQIVLVHALIIQIYAVAAEVVLAMAAVQIIQAALNLITEHFAELLWAIMLSANAYTELASECAPEPALILMEASYGPALGRAYKKA